MKPANHLTVSGLVLKDALCTRFLFYHEDAEEISMDLSGMKAEQSAVAIDTKRPYAEIPLKVLAPKKQTWQAPYASDWAIAVGE
jgi:hypothetical protein